MIMSLQNCRPIADELNRLCFFRRLDLRIMQITYNFSYALGHCCLEPEEASQTLLSRDAVRIENEIGIAIDLGHVGQQTMRETVAASEQPVLITHVFALANLERNKTNDIILKLSKRPHGMRYHNKFVEAIGTENVGFRTDHATGNNYLKMAFERTHWRRWKGIDHFNRFFGEYIPSRYLSNCNKHSDLPKISEVLVARASSEKHIKGHLGGYFCRVLNKI